MVREGGSGGSLELVRRIEASGEALLADFREYYSLDLSASLFGGELRPREVLTLIAMLPESSRYNAVQMGGMEHYGWTQDRYMGAATYNVLQIILYVFTQSKTKKRIQKPELWPMPGKPRMNKKSEEGGFAQMIAKAKERRRARQGE